MAAAGPRLTLTLSLSLALSLSLSLSLSLTLSSYASATSNSTNRPISDDPNDRYKMQRVVLDAPHVLPPGCWRRTRTLEP